MRKFSGTETPTETPATQLASLTGDRMTADPAANEQPLATGSRVELTKHLYGHVAGAQGAVVRTAVKGQTKVLIRFDDTGYEIAVPPEALKPLA